MAILLATVAVAQVYDSWIGHAIIAIISLILMIYTIISGAMLNGRIKRGSVNVFPHHKRNGIYLSAFILGSFIYGFWMRFQHGDPILSSIHGRLGLIILLIMILQIAPSLLLKDRSRYRGLHRVGGYLLAPILILDAAWGLYNSVLAETKSLVLCIQYLAGWPPLHSSG